MANSQSKYPWSNQNAYRYCIPYLRYNFACNFLGTNTSDILTKNHLQAERVDGRQQLGVEAWKLLSLSPMAEGNWKHGSRWQVLSHPFTGFHMGFECLSWGTLGKEIISFQLGRFDITKRNVKPLVSLIMVWTKQMQKQRILFVQKDVLYIVKKEKEIL